MSSTLDSNPVAFSESRVRFPIAANKKMDCVEAVASNINLTLANPNPTLEDQILLEILAVRVPDNLPLRVAMNAYQPIPPDYLNLNASPVFSLIAQRKGTPIAGLNKQQLLLLNLVWRCNSLNGHSKDVNTMRQLLANQMNSYITRHADQLDLDCFFWVKDSGLPRSLWHPRKSHVQVQYKDHDVKYF